MKKKTITQYSQYLQRDMRFNVYGEQGKPFLVFPSQDGRYFDFENNGMVKSVENWIDEGKIQLFCVDSIDQESWSNTCGNPQHRMYMHEQWFHYILDEVIPLIFEINMEVSHERAKGIMTTGCSMGATHAVNFMLRRPDVFCGTIAMSGYYDSDLFFGDYHDDLLYFNSPIQYLNGMTYDHPYVDMYRQCEIILCTGQGAWEDDMVRSAHRMKELFMYKDIPAWIDFWGYDVCHDWLWWQKQFPYFIEKVI